MEKRISSALPAHRNFWRTDCGLHWKEHLHLYGAWQPVSPRECWCSQHSGESDTCAKFLTGIHWSKLPAKGQQLLFQSTARKRPNWSHGLFVNYRKITLSSDKKGGFQPQCILWILTKHQSLALFIHSIQLRFTSFTRIARCSFPKIHCLVGFSAVMNCPNFIARNLGSALSCYNRFTHSR